MSVNPNNKCTSRSKAAQKRHEQLTKELKKRQTQPARDALAAARVVDAPAVMRSIEAFKGLAKFDPARPETIAEAVLSYGEVEPSRYALALVALSLFAPWRVASFTVEAFYAGNPWVEGENGDLLSIWATPEAAADLVRLTSWTQSAEKRRSVVQSAGIPKEGRGHRVVTESPMVQGIAELLTKTKASVNSLGPLLGMEGETDG